MCFILLSLNSSSINFAMMNVGIIKKSMVNSTKIKTIILKCFDIKINFRFRIPPQRKHCTNQNSNRNPTTLTPTLTFQSRTLTATRTGFFFGFGKTGPFCLMHFWKWKTKSFCFFFLLLIQTNSQKHSFFRFWTKNRIKYTILLQIFLNVNFSSTFSKNKNESRENPKMKTGP